MYKLCKQEHEFREKMRGRYPMDPKWYAVMTHCGREHEVYDRIAQGFAGDGVDQIFLPELKAHGKSPNGRHKRHSLLFACYVFLRCRMSDEIYMEISAYETVYSILGRAYRIPSAIEDTEMTHLKGILTTYPAPMMSPRLNIGAEALVTKGLMEGMRGRVVEYNANFAKIETCFSFFDNGTSVIVHVPLSQLRLEETGFFSAGAERDRAAQFASERFG